MKNMNKKKIKEIMKDKKCLKKYICLKSEFEYLCKAKDMGYDNFLECLEKNSAECTFALSFGHGHLCKCPLRIYIAKEMKK